MGCGSCSSKGGGCSTGGCGSSGGCSSGGCNKLNSFDWLANMVDNPYGVFDIIEIRFKGGRKEFFRNTKAQEFFTGDPLLVDLGSGNHDLGFVSMQGELVRLQMKKKNVKNNDEIKVIIGKADQKDLDKLQKAKSRELPTLIRAREISKDKNVDMKISDVDFQYDEKRATFYYSAEERVDFREIIKLMATEFRTRIEMKQINLRQEAGRLGGIGACGRELCCSTWLTDFKNVSSNAARYQNLSFNPAKLSGQCGRLKCCLNFELDTYIDAVKDFPNVSSPLETEQGKAFVQKTDIFKKLMWFAYDRNEEWIPISVADVKKIQFMNKQGSRPYSLDLSASQSQLDTVVENRKSDLEDLDKKYSKNKGKTNFQHKNQGNQKPRFEDKLPAYPARTAPAKPQQTDFEKPLLVKKEEISNQNTPKPQNQANNNPNQKGFQPRQGVEQADNKPKNEEKSEPRILPNIGGLQSIVQSVKDNQTQKPQNQVNNPNQKGFQPRQGVNQADNKPKNEEKSEPKILPNIGGLQSIVQSVKDNQTQKPQNQGNNPNQKGFQPRQDFNKSNQENNKPNVSENNSKSEQKPLENKPNENTTKPEVDPNKSRAWQGTPRQKPNIE